MKDGLQALIEALDPTTFKQRLEGALVRTLPRVAATAERIGKRLITNGGEYAPNAESTKAGKKGSSWPLVNHGDLLGSIKGIVSFADGTADVILGANKRSDRGANIAAILHKGTRPGTKPKIPARPFLATPLRSQEVTKAHREALARALRLAFGDGRGR